MRRVRGHRFVASLPRGLSEHLRDRVAELERDFDPVRAAALVAEIHARANLHISYGAALRRHAELLPAKFGLPPTPLVKLALVPPDGGG